jgi:cyanophycinase
MRLALRLASVFAVLFSAPALAAPMAHGPDKGSLIIVGGGKVGPEILDRFFALAGGKDAPIVIIPTAGGQDAYGPDYAGVKVLTDAGATHVTILHTADRAEADSAAFVKPITEAKAIWIPGGRQWHLVDSYLGTRTKTEIDKLLARGGVVMGSSAGASIQASYLVRGAREGNEVMMAPGYEEGFGLLKNAAVDQHVITRGRQTDLDAVVAKHPDLLGVGLDESTAIVVHGDRFDVIGKSKVFVHDGKSDPSGLTYHLLASGDRYDMDALAVGKTNP